VQQRRLDAKPEAMRQRREAVERPDGRFRTGLPEKVIAPLQKHLRVHGLRPVIGGSIERIALEKFTVRDHPTRPIFLTKCEGRSPPILPCARDRGASANGDFDKTNPNLRRLCLKRNSDSTLSADSRL
jgi:hypothetical protein